ncbi:MAG TPA: G1 family glutamic endopeptidase, partial [Acidimicrobiales bacterium]|nr:G1 family glutamic endopeptidase [Acidimicrobiales bacterium]
IQPFYEWLNYGSAGQTTVISGFTKGVHAGDHMQASVEYSSFYQQADFLLVDGRTGEWGPNTNISVPKSYYDGATVEWINEDPGGGSVPLSNYDESPCGCIPWSEVSATDSNGATVTLGGAYPTYLINMYNTAYDPNPADTGPTLFYEKPFGPEDASSLMSSTDGYSYDTDGSASFNTNWWQGEDDLQEYCETGNPNWSGCRGVLN